jgi:hypothetical protein
MIENRAKIEKQIFLGRQAVRRSLQSKSKPQVMLQADVVSEPKTDVPVPRISTTPPQTGSDLPMSVDTDAETAFANGSRWFFKRGHAHASLNSGTPTPRDSSPNRDPLRSPMIRRKWAADLLNPTSHVESSHRGVVPHKPPLISVPIAKHGNSKAPSSSFFNRLRTKSFPNLSSPFSQDHKISRLGNESSVDTAAERAWSSDSSSEDDLSVDDQRHIHHPSVLNLTDYLDPTYPKDNDEDTEGSRG